MSFASFRHHRKRGFDMTPYHIRYNTKHRGYVLVSCSNGHSIESVKTDKDYAGSAAEARLGRRSHKCRDCEAAGITKKEIQ